MGIIRLFKITLTRLIDMWAHSTLRTQRFCYILWTCRTWHPHAHRSACKILITAKNTHLCVFSSSRALRIKIRFWSAPRQVAFRFWITVEIFKCCTDVIIWRISNIITRWTSLVEFWKSPSSSKCSRKQSWIWHCGKYQAEQACK